MITLVDEIVKVPKELNEVRKALVAVIGDIKQGKDVAEIAAGNFNLLVAAVGGIDQLDDEVKAELAASVAAAGLLTADIIGVLVPKPA